MDRDASRARAEELAEKLLGKSQPSGDMAVLRAITEGAFVGQRADDESRTPIRKTRKVVDDDDSSEEETLDEEDDDTEAEGQDGDADTEEDTDDQDDETDDEEVDDEDDEEESDDESEDDELETVEYDDDDLIDVNVDGETQRVSLRDLKRRYAGNGAIEKRLQEATETRKAAQAERAAFLKEATEHHQKLVETVTALDSSLFAPLVAKPDANLRLSNPTQYAYQKDLYDEDVDRIEKLREKFAGFFQQQNQKLTQMQNENRAEQARMLVDKLPALKNPKLAPKVQKSIMDAAAFYGFSPQDVAAASDHRLFLMARDAGLWRRMQELKENGGTKKVPLNGGAKRRKVMKAGGAVSQNAGKAKVTREKAAIVKQARSGKVGDIANMLLANATIKGTKNGRSRKNT